MSTAEVPATSITMPEASSSDVKAKAPVTPEGPAPVAAKRASRIATILNAGKAHGEWRRGIALFDFFVRIFAIASAVAATIIMGTANETLPFFTEFFQFHARFSDLPALTFFVVASAVTGGYLLLSLFVSCIGIVRPGAAGPRLVLLVFDTVMLTLTTSAAAAATAIVYLAHNGDSRADWVAICLRYDGFCQRISAAVATSFVTVFLFMLLVVMSALAMRKH